MTPDSFPEPAPDATPEPVDGAEVDGIDRAAAPETVDASGPDDAGTGDTADVDVRTGDVAHVDVADAVPVDAVPVDAVSADEVSADEVSADEVSADEVPVVEVSALEVVADDGPADDAAVAGQALPEPDPVLAESVEAARAAAVELGGEDVGEHLGASAEDAHAVTHAFVATLAGYRGWHWAVTLARSPESSVVTVDEVVLLPGDDALRAPEWVPWSQRVRAGDLGAGDLLPADPDDARLVPSYFSDDDPSLADADAADRAQLRTVADELGLGRVRVLSRDGRIDAAERWLETDFGPDAPMAKQAPAHCGTCGFLVLVRGSLGGAFGICANELSAADAHVVSVEFGCGAHSEAGVDLTNRVEPAGNVYDSGELVMEPNDVAAADFDDTVAVDDV